MVATNKQRKKKSLLDKEEIGSLEKNTTKKQETRKIAITEKEKPFHALIRVKSEDGKTIKAHAEIIRKEGVAILGKIGQPLGLAFMTALNKQVQNGNKTYLFLATREGWNGPYVIYQCELNEVQPYLVGNKQNLVPSYYSSEFKLIKTWFEIKTITKLSNDEMSKIYVLSSGRGISSVINSSASIFRVGLTSENK